MLMLADRLINRMEYIHSQARIRLTSLKSHRTPTELGDLVIFTITKRGDDGINTCVDPFSVEDVVVTKLTSRNHMKDFLYSSC